MLYGAKIGAVFLAGLLSVQMFSSALTGASSGREVLNPEQRVESGEIQPQLHAGWLPEDCYRPAEEGHRGTVVEDQVPGHEDCPHSFTVYLPPQYQEDGQYNLLIFLGPYDGKPGDCIDETFDTWYTEPFRFADIFDQLIARGLTEPFLVVQPDYLSWQDLPVGYDTVSESIRRELLPYVAEHYATYAENGTDEALTAARGHIAMGGASLGGMYTFRGLLRDCADVSAYFCPMSCKIDLTKVLEEICRTGKDHPVTRLIYVFGGFEEPKLQGTGDYLQKVLPELFTPENVVSLRLEGTHHFYSTWAAGLWNVLQMIWDRP